MNKKILNAKIIILCLTITLIQCDFKKEIQSKSELKIAGIVLAHVNQKNKGYGSAASKPLYKHFKELGLNSVQFNTFAYQKNIQTPKLIWRGRPNLSTDSVLKEIERAHQHKITVMLKPHIWIGGFPPNEWRNEIDYKNPSKRNKWFNEYKRFIQDQIDIAIQGQVEYFIIGTELVRLTKYTEFWYELITMIKESGYQGQLSYACESWNAKNIKFWNQLDFIGLNFYYPFKNQPQLPKNLIQFYKEKILEHASHAKSLNKPIVFTEFGFPSHNQAIFAPHSWPSKDNSINLEQQSLGYESVYLAMKKNIFPMGIYFWKYVTSLESYESNSYPKGFNLYHKPAEKKIKLYTSQFEKESRLK